MIRISSKGDFVHVAACVYTKHVRYPPKAVFPGKAISKLAVPKNIHAIHRNLMRMECDFEGIVVGYSTRIAGNYIMGNGWEDPGVLLDIQSFRVIMVCSTHTQRWEPPYACLQEDLFLITHYSMLVKRKQGDKE